MEWIRRHLSFANVTSLCALFVALSGAAYAGINLPRNSVGSKQIKAKAVKADEIKGKAVTAGKIAPNAVKASKIVDGSVGGGELNDGGIGLIDLGANSVDGTKVADGSLGLADLGPNSVDGTKLADNSVNGAKVEDGSLGSADLGPNTFMDPRVTVQFVQHTADLANGAEVSVDVHCLDGQTAIGGGTRGDLNNSELTKVTASRPIIATDNTGAPASNGTFTGWRGTFVNENNGAGIRPEVWVICAGPTPPAP
jgi:hypothetical protein